ncbi:D-arabinose-5-phosphate isomerase (EC [Olavius algarvensis associated proteobacterium Delta 3]|nr:D-arabinose-5-phosphate isomerase (EC [Olavius algarvensis associated proteobacterium Delta 3]CAB5121269.1 D-arabinose-5-phosphate isomerase (EC [Olavius algarvensis associated proteobacterium Delta 3]
MIKDDAIEVLKLEAEGILKLANRIDDRFVEMVDIIYNAKGRVIVAGIGKSGIVARKIVATLNSTGTRSLFLHPVEAVHGDLGIVSADDVFLALSNSGETDELNILLPSIRHIGCSIIGFTGNTESTLARGSDIVIDIGVDREACPLGLAPTTSTTALLAMGDALAVVLIKKRDFRPSDFRKYHPGGTLGQRLTSRVKDIMMTGNAVPKITQASDMATAIDEIERLQLGATLVVDQTDTLVGIITDGDVRRAVARREAILNQPIAHVMTPNPRTVRPETPTYDALNVMEKFQITVLPITNPIGRVRGILHLHDILGKGEFKFNGR